MFQSNLIGTLFTITHNTFVELELCAPNEPAVKIKDWNDKLGVWVKVREATSRLRCFSTQRARSLLPHLALAALCRLHARLHLPLLHMR